MIMISADLFLVIKMLYENCFFNFRAKNVISIWNNGRGIPIEIHKEQNVYVPTLIFGQLLTSSNYDDTQKKVTGGRNGFGAKLCNIFSKKFVVETACSESGKKFKQVRFLCCFDLNSITLYFETLFCASSSIPKLFISCWLTGNEPIDMA